MLIPKIDCRISVCLKKNTTQRIDCISGTNIMGALYVVGMMLVLHEVSKMGFCCYNKIFCRIDMIFIKINEYLKEKSVLRMKMPITFLFHFSRIQPMARRLCQAAMHGTRMSTLVTTRELTICTGQRNKNLTPATPVVRKLFT